MDRETLGLSIMGLNIVGQMGAIWWLLVFGLTLLGFMLIITVTTILQVIACLIYGRR